MDLNELSERYNQRKSSVTSITSVRSVSVSLSRTVSTGRTRVLTCSQHELEINPFESSFGHFLGAQKSPQIRPMRPFSLDSFMFKTGVTSVSRNSSISSVSSSRNSDLARDTSNAHTSPGRSGWP